MTVESTEDDLMGVAGGEGWWWGNLWVRLEGGEVGLVGELEVDWAAADPLDEAGGEGLKGDGPAQLDNLLFLQT